MQSKTVKFGKKSNPLVSSNCTSSVEPQATPGSRTAPRAPSSRGKDTEARAKAPTGNVFSSKWKYISDVGLYDLRDLLFKLNPTDGPLPLTKGYTKEDMLAVVEYVLGMDPSESLDTKFRPL